MPGPVLSILDVGHGNCAVLVDDRTIVIDCGPGTTLLEFLRGEGITEVAAIIISHADEDHIKGLVSLLESRTVEVRLVRVNSDAIKGSKTWDDLAFLLDAENKSGSTRFDVGLTTNQSGEFDGGSVNVQVLAPSPYLAAKGAGSTDRKGRKITSNSMSAVIRLVNDGKPKVLLPGDLDDVGFENLLESGQEMRAPIVVFPHHGGGSGGDPSSFARRFLEAAAAGGVVFSIGRGRYSTPRPDLVAAALASGARVICTQLSEHCASELPKADATHLTQKFARGRGLRHCCGGTLTVNLSVDTPTLLPNVDVHQEFIRTSAPSALCKRASADS